MRWPKVQVEPGQQWFDRRRNANHVLLILNRHSDGRWCVRRVCAQPYDFFMTENALRNRFNPRLKERTVGDQPA